MSRSWSVEGLEVDLGRFHLGPIDLTIAPGRGVAVLGPSGAGKTTLLRTLAGFVRPRRGRIRCDGVDMTATPPEARRLGYVPQGLGLFPHRSVEANVRYPLEIRGRPDARERTAALLKRFHLAPLARRRPSRLSGGEQQRVAIARALAADPGLVVWDEPWQGLDVLARHELGVVLHELREEAKVPIVVVTHDPGLAFSVADSFLVLRRGRVEAQCDAATLLAAPADAFAARFVGYANVLEPERLRGGPGSLRRWLSERTGPGGVAFAAPVLPDPGGSGPTWEGTVRSVRPGPGGVAVEVRADELVLALRLGPGAAAPVPRVGDPVRFSVDPSGIIRLGDGGPGG